MASYYIDALYIGGNISLYDNLPASLAVGDTVNITNGDIDEFLEITSISTTFWDIGPSYFLEPDASVMLTVTGTGSGSDTINFAFGVSSTGKVFNFTGSAVPPVAPNAPVASIVSGSSTSVAWTALSDPSVTKYEMQVSVGGGAYGTTTNVGLTSPKVWTGLVDGSYKYRIRAVNSYGNGAWSSDSNTVVLDDTPNSFGFTNKSSANLSTYYEATTTISGYVQPVTVSATNGAQVRIGTSGNWYSSVTANPTTQTIGVRMQSSASYSTAKTTTVTAGGTSANWTITTAVMDETPSGFNDPTDITGAELDTYYYSVPYTVTGINTSVAVTATAGAAAKINNGSYISGYAGTVVAGDQVTFRIASSSSYQTAVNASIGIGTVSHTWTATTRAKDTTPSGFTAPSAVTGAQLSEYRYTEPYTITGIDPAVTVSGSSGVAFKINSGSYVTSGTVNSGDTVIFRQQASGSYSTLVSRTITVGSTSYTWNVTTRAKDTTPSGFYQPLAVGSLVPNAWAYTDTYTITGIDPAVPVTGGPNVEFSIAGGSYVTSGTINSGQTVRFRGKAASTYNTTVQRMVAVGSTTYTWYLDTLANPPTSTIGISEPPIALSDVITFFGGGTKLSQFVRAGAYVPNLVENADISTTATGLKLSQFFDCAKN
ncbi:fibronectin type III domain-containing protein [Bowmanella sp. JS7-9]|uniref:Fibronectin type III domain-containing protein n=1 Tax=Pseudobowmanella zhangzhouensis TaxID=1537679 RepID=A0ABW1XMG5_9ALTE|nr:fibronectin type III domain-containing protein [Bowmanella sp. JS7-9]TBX21925.1 hypothetical protein TK45_10580 [Bowmanella sp. JS7-9]